MMRRGSKALAGAIFSLGPPCFLVANSCLSSTARDLFEAQRRADNGAVDARKSSKRVPGLPAHRCWARNAAR
jgi:hypothetical protein